MAQSNKKSKKLWLTLLLIGLGLILFFGQSISSLINKAEIEMKIVKNPFVMPAVSKVYENPEAFDGKYNLFKMLITNTSGSIAKDIEVAFEIPGYIEMTSIEKIPLLLPGQSFVVNCHPKFKSEIVEKTTKSKEKVNIKVSGLNIEEQEESFPIDIMGRNQFMYTQIPKEEMSGFRDMFDNDALLACLVTPEDPIVKYYTQQIQEKILKGEQATVTKTAEEGVRFLTGIYQGTLSSHMVYSGSGGFPVNDSDYSASVQNIRLPRELITGNTGLCIELSLLYASIMLQAGLNPVIFMVPGHAYPGFELNGNHFALEATGIGGEGLNSIMSAEQAFNAGMKEYEEFVKMYQAGDPRYWIINIKEAIDQGAVPMELKDDSFLRKKVDEIAMSFGGGVPQEIAFNPVANTGGGNTGGRNTGGGNATAGGNDGGGTPAGFKQYNGEVSFMYPSSWKALGGFQNPYITKVVGNSSGGAKIQVYSFKGAGSPDQAMMALKQSIESKGYMIDFQKTGQESGFTVYQGMTSGGNNSFNWIAAFKKAGNGVSGITFTNNDGSLNQTKIATIFNSLR